MVLRFFFYDFSKPSDSAVNNKRLGNNLTLYAFDKNIKAGEIVSSMSYDLAEQMNLSAQLYLNNKSLNYLANYNTSFMVVIYYKKLTSLLDSGEEALDKSKAMYDIVKSEIQKHNKAVSDEFKSNLGNESDKIIEQILTIKNKDKDEIAEFTTSMIMSFLKENSLSEMNIHIHNHIKDWLLTFGNNFSKALDQRIRNGTSFESN